MHADVEGPIAPDWNFDRALLMQIRFKTRQGFKHEFENRGLNGYPTPTFAGKTRPVTCRQNHFQLVKNRSEVNSKGRYSRSAGKGELTHTCMHMRGAVAKHFRVRR
jgi:hypothetical protein